MGRRLCHTVACLALLVGTTGPTMAADMQIDWSVCPQPDRASAAYVKQQSEQIDAFVSAARKQHGGKHIAVALNSYYGAIVQLRRDFVVRHYRPVSPSRPATACALTPADYTRLLILRDASYYVLCRAEVAIGQNKPARLAKDLKSLAYASVYDFLKTIGLDMRAKPGEPTTPPGGYAGCAKGVDDGLDDPFPSAAETIGFTTRLVVPDSEKQRIGDPTRQ